MLIEKNHDASNNLTVSINDLPSFKYKYLRWKIAAHFCLEKKGDYISGGDEKSQGYINTQGEVTIDWDIWSGFMVTSLSSDSDLLVEKIHQWLENKYS